MENTSAPQLTPGALAERERLAQAKQRQREAEEARHRQLADEAIHLAADLWAGASEEGYSPYLERKGVGAHGLRFQRDGTLLVPMRSAAGVLCNVQRIAPQKPTPEQEEAGANEKWYIKGGRKAGLWHLLGTLPKPAPLVLLLAEGYATAATLYEAVGHPTAVCFDGGNLPTVAKELRQLYPNALLLVCGDDDVPTFERTGRNPGRSRTYAAKAARAVEVKGAALAGCVFPEPLPAGGSDFNDLAASLGAISGLAVVRALVQAAVLAPQIPKINMEKTYSIGAVPWREAVGRYCVGNSRLVFAVSCAFAAGLLGRVYPGVKPLAFHLRGPAASGKSTALQVARSVWGGLGDGGFCALDEASATPNARRLLPGQLVRLSAGELVFWGDDGRPVACVNLASAGGAGLFQTLHGFASPAELADHLASAARHTFGTPGRLWHQTLDVQAAAVPAALVRLLASQPSNIPMSFALVAAAGELATAAGLTGWPESEALRGVAECLC